MYKKIFSSFITAAILAASLFVSLSAPEEPLAADYSKIFFSRRYHCSVTVMEKDIFNNWKKLEITYRIGKPTRQIKLPGYKKIPRDWDRHVFSCQEPLFDEGQFTCTYDDSHARQPFMMSKNLKIYIPGGAENAKVTACKDLLAAWKDNMADADRIYIKRLHIWNKQPPGLCCLLAALV